MNNPKALKLLAECVNIAAGQYPAMAEEYWAALREVSQRKNEWISVKDRLPECNHRVIVCRPEMKNADTGPVSVQWGWICSRKRADVTHWMPLPEPPKEESECLEK